jgi:intracellular sulfur oxidation DsrE/DsrF family protein
MGMKNIYNSVASFFSSKQKSVYKVVIQLSNEDTAVHKAMIKQLNNALEALDKLEIEVVVHGQGIGFLLLSSPVINNIEKLQKKGVRFLVCKNTLNDKKLEPSALYAGSKVIASGVAHLIVRQSQGWSYLKAGF